MNPATINSGSRLQALLPGPAKKILLFIISVFILSLITFIMSRLGPPAAFISFYRERAVRFTARYRHRQPVPRTPWPIKQIKTCRILQTQARK